jgi:hypothetical protein
MLLGCAGFSWSCGDDVVADPATTSAGPGSGGGQGGAGGTTGTAGQGGAGGAPVPPEITAACEALAEPFCTGIFNCLDFVAQTYFADEAECEARRTKGCERAFMASGSDAMSTAAMLQTCAGATPDPTDCPSVIKSFYHGPDWVGFPSECFFTGDAADGAACKIGADCQSGICGGYEGTTALCGTCQPQLAEGDPCMGPCAPGLACANGTCTVLGDVGAMCNTDFDCLIDSWCDNGSCAALLDTGGACDPMGAVYCDFDNPVCNNVTNQCEATAPFAMVGGACWVQMDGSLNLCSDSACQINAVTGMGTCIETAEEGEPCMPANNLWGYQSNCAFPLLCFGGTCQYFGDVLECQ